MAALLRLLTILALAAMPLGMSAQAAPASHAMAADGGHCDGPKQSDRQAPLHQSDCAVSCAAIAPSPLLVEKPVPVAAGGTAMAPVMGLPSITLEIVPPPPKVA